MSIYTPRCRQAPPICAKSDNCYNIIKSLRMHVNITLKSFMKYISLVQNVFNNKSNYLD